MNFKNTKVSNFEGAFRGMRNPKNSWNRSDSYFGLVDGERFDEACFDVTKKWLESKDGAFNERMKWLLANGILNSTKDDSVYEVAFIGPNDMKLAKTLIKSGSEHRKFLRQIFVSVDITAPIYWYKELDTYKVGTTANSTSTMHKIASTPITLDCFETGDFCPNLSVNEEDNFVYDYAENFVRFLETLRLKYLETKDKKYWKELIRWLPESWLQTRTVTMNYENLLGMCGKGQRRFHKLTEWSEDFIKWGRSLPYAQDLIFLDELDEKE